MKTVTLIFSMMAFLVFNSFGQNANVKELLEKPESRNEIFNTILNDHKLLMEFRKAMNENEHAMMMMQGNSQMMSQKVKVEMNKEHHMMDHSKMMANMMTICKLDTAMCSKMANMMTEHPDMMQKCMQKMEMKNSESKSEKKDHNHQH